METAISKIKDPVKRLFAFAHERYMIYIRKENIEPPWTKDPILRDFRFCNIYREDDKVTRWIRENWRNPHSDDEDLWFALCIARLLNRPEALATLHWPVPFVIQHFARRLVEYKKEGGKIFNPAYIVSTNGISIDKLAYISHDILTPLWKARERLRPNPGDTLNSYHMLLGQFQGFGSFMSAQVIADLKYHGPLRQASDWHTFAASGPGSRRGLNYVLGRNRKDIWQEDEWRLELGRLREKLLPMFKAEQMPQPHAQDVQNILCEFNKYWAAIKEDKRPKQRYKWKEEK